jgi:cobalt/nickel transport system ATP-binding protein
MTAPALVLRDVTVRHPQAASPVLRDVSFELAAGERVALLGLNGSGKTSLLMAVAGLVPFTGEIRVAGTTLGSRTTREVRDHLGVLFNVPEDQLLFPRVVDDVAFGLVRRGVPSEAAHAAAREGLAALGVADLAGHDVPSLSHGQKQRVALAGALVTRPALLLLDEPSAALDPPGRVALARLLCATPAAQLLATHDLEFARRVCARTVVLADGRVAYDGDDPREATAAWRED